MTSPPTSYTTSWDTTLSSVEAERSRDTGTVGSGDRPGPGGTSHAEGSGGKR